MPAYAIGEKAADLIKGVSLKTQQGVKIHQNGSMQNVNGNGTVTVS